MLFGHCARNPFYLKQQLDFYGAGAVGLDVTECTVDPENKRGRVLTPDYVFDLRHSFDGTVFGWTQKPVDLGVAKWLKLPTYVLWQEALIVSTQHVPVLNLAKVDPVKPPFDGYDGTIAFANADLLLEMSYLPPERVYALAAWLKSV